MSLLRITTELGKRGGYPCVRSLRISVCDVQGWLTSGMSETEILEDYPELEGDDILTCIETDSQKPFSPSLSKVTWCA